ncbi:helix-turn-helix domain-containing protein [Streptococcus sp. O1]|uniref:helix-turn-helix domain-containing protein n=1 Tax=Streptococcus sp. O1 TaxID=2928735 RepID=UPI00211B49F6|nr:helix-turn-helix domain-containing protein [Streptococcus sp. O1]MCQ9212972.1 helix-turn-helix domain-containing protein [Streptococcus sp. O1]
MNDFELALFVGQKIKEFRLMRGLTQKELATHIDMGDTTIVNYEKGIRSPKKNTLFKIADILSVSIDDFFPPISATNDKDSSNTSPNAKNDTVQAINDTVVQLHPERQEIVLEVATAQLDEQENETPEIREEPAVYNSDKVVPFSRKEKEFESLIVHGLESAGDGIWQEEDADIEVQSPKMKFPMNLTTLLWLLEILCVLNSITEMFFLSHSKNKLKSDKSEYSEPVKEIS